MTVDQLIARLERDRFAIDNTDPLDVAYRRGFNAAMAHVIGIVRGERVTSALRELRDAPAVDMRPAFDLSDGES